MTLTVWASYVSRVAFAIKNIKKKHKKTEYRSVSLLLFINSVGGEKQRLRAITAKYVIVIGMLLKRDNLYRRICWRISASLTSTAWLVLIKLSLIMSWELGCRSRGWTGVTLWHRLLSLSSDLSAWRPSTSPQTETTWVTSPTGKHTDSQNVK